MCSCHCCFLLLSRWIIWDNLCLHRKIPIFRQEIGQECISPWGCTCGSSSWEKNAGFQMGSAAHSFLKIHNKIHTCWKQFRCSPKVAWMYHSHFPLFLLFYVLKEVEIDTKLEFFLVVLKCASFTKSTTEDQRGKRVCAWLDFLGPLVLQIQFPIWVKWSPHGILFESSNCLKFRQAVPIPWQIGWFWKPICLWVCNACEWCQIN